MEETIQPKIGYKGFDKNLCCRKEQFEVGKIYTKPYVEVLKCCTDQGYHYCNNLKDIDGYYSFSGDNRFCEIEILGKFTDNGNKSITTSFKIIRELSRLEIDKILNKDRFNLELVRKLQAKHPEFHIGGSTALYLYGITIKRWFESGYKSDLDLVTPYYIKVESDDNLNVEEINAKPSGNDFDETFLCNGVKVDFKVDPHQKYEYVEFDGHKYKVSLLETIMAAKFKYALNRQNKHKEDVREICGVKN